MRITFANKRVLLIGLGRYPRGSGISSALYTLRAGAIVHITDKKSGAEFREQMRLLRPYANRITTTFGTERLDDVRACDVVIANPGVRATSHALVLAKKLRKPITSDMEIFLSQCPARVVAITGSKGKSSTTALVTRILKKKYASVFMGGNVGVSPLMFLSRLKKSSLVVLELSSWQLHQLPKDALAVDTAVLTNIYKDHLNAYLSFAAYRKDKQRLFDALPRSAVAIASAEDTYAVALLRTCVAKKLSYAAKKLAYGGDAVWLEDGARLYARYKGKTRYMGDVANIFPPSPLGNNVLASLCVGVRYGVAWQKLVAAIARPPKMEGRRQRVPSTDGVWYVNDTTATIPDATLAALGMFTGKRVHLIVGGQDKGVDYDALAKRIATNVRTCVFLPGDASTALLALIKEAGAPHVHIARARTMLQAVRCAQAQAVKGDVVLLSPGAASFSSFKNEFDRGRQFVAAVRKRNIYGTREKKQQLKT